MRLAFSTKKRTRCQGFLRSDVSIFLLKFLRSFFQKATVILFTCLFDCNCNGHNNHGVVTCADETLHLYVKLYYEEASPINILGDEHIIQMYSCTHYSRYEISQIGIDTCVIIERCFKVQNIVLIGLFINVLNRHFRGEELIEI